MVPKGEPEIKKMLGWRRVSWMGMERQRGRKRTVWGAETLQKKDKAKRVYFKICPEDGHQESPLHLFPPKSHFLLSLKNQIAINLPSSVPHRCFHTS